MDERQKTSSNVFSEKSIIENTLIETNKKYYTKEDIQEILNPIFNYLELLSETYDINIDDFTKFNFKRPNLNDL